MESALLICILLVQMGGLSPPEGTHFYFIAQGLGGGRGGSEAGWEKQLGRKHKPRIPEGHQGQTVPLDFAKGWSSGRHGRQPD